MSKQVERFHVVGVLSVVDDDHGQRQILLAFLLVAASGCAVGLLLGWLLWGWL